MLNKFVDWFVNREKQRKGFLRMLKRETPKQIMFVEAPNDMGKTWLVERLRHECRVQQVPVAHFDFSSRHPLDYLAIVRHVRDEFGPMHFNEMTQVINQSTDITIRLDPGSGAGGDVGIGVGDVTDGQVNVGDVAGGHIVKDNYYEIKVDSEEVQRRTRDCILEIFFKCLETFSQEQVVVFLFDTYETVKEEARLWVEGELLYRVRYGRLPNVLVVLAGQKTPEVDRSAWNHILACTDLEPFSREDVREYLQRTGQVDLHLETIVITSGGHPKRLGEMIDLALASKKEDDEDWI